MSFLTEPYTKCKIWVHKEPTQKQFPSALPVQAKPDQTNLILPRMYDVDGNGVIDQEEMTKIVQVLH